MEPTDLNQLNAEYALATIQQVVALVHAHNNEFHQQHGKQNAMLMKLGKWFLKVQHGLEKAVIECQRAGI
jgi:hypothetical protein